MQAKWQTALGFSGTIGNVVGIIINSSMTEKYGHKRVLLATYVVMILFVFVPFFSPNIGVLFAGQIPAYPSACFRLWICVRGLSSYLAWLFGHICRVVLGNWSIDCFWNLIRLHRSHRPMGLSHSFRYTVGLATYSHSANVFRTRISSVVGAQGSLGGCRDKLEPTFVSFGQGGGKANYCHDGAYDQS